MMNSGTSSSGERAVDRSNESHMDLESWVNELLADNCSDSVANSGVDAMTINPNYSIQPNMTTRNSGTTLRGGSANKSQSGVAHEVMTVSTAKSSTALLQRSGQMLSAAPNDVIPNPVAQSSRLCNLVQPTQDLQHQPLRQQVFKNKAVQQPQTHSSMEQPNIFFGQQKNNHQMTLDQLRPCPKPMLNSQTGHLQNQQPLRLQSNTSQLQQQQPQILQPMQTNKQQLQFQQPTGSTSHNLMSADGRHRFQGFVIREGQRKPQEQQQGNIPDAWSAPVGFIAPSVFPIVAAWNEYAFRQILQMKERYMTELLIMYRNAKNFHVQETNTDAPNKYGDVTVFLEKMIMFLNISTVDSIPKNSERVYNYMNFIVNYINSIRNKNSGSSQQREHVNQQPVHQPPTPTSSQSKQPQLQPSGGMKLQPSLSQGIPHLDANMVNFNQNFPSRWPPARTPSMGIEQRPLKQLRIGSFNVAQPNVLGTTQQGSSGPKTSSTFNVAGSPLGLLATTTAANFPSRQLNNQPTLENKKFNSEKLKQPMHKVNELAAESKVGQMMSPLGSRLLNQFQSPQFSLPSAAKTINLQAASPVSSWHPVSSSRVDANNVLMPQSIARSPFLLAASSTPSQQKQWHSTFGLSSLSTAESKKPETPIMPGQFGDLSTIVNQVADTGAPRTPTTSSMDAAPLKEKRKESQDFKDPHTRLIEAVKSLSSKALSSSLNDICSAEKAINSIPDGEPTIPIGPYTENDNGLEQKINGMLDGEPPNLDGSGFVLENEYEQEQRIRRKLCVTSCMDRSSIVTSMKERPEIEYKNGAILLEEIKEINSKLLETSLHVVLDDAAEYDIGSCEGTIVKCLYKNGCCPQLLTLQEAASSEEMPGFDIQLFVPVNYPASSPTIINSGCNVLSSGPWAKLYEETMTRFKCALRVIPKQIISLEDMARNWDVCAQAVISEFAERRGGKSFSSTYGSWETCMNSSSGSN